MHNLFRQSSSNSEPAINNQSKHSIIYVHPSAITQKIIVQINVLQVGQRVVRQDLQKSHEAAVSETAMRQSNCGESGELVQRPRNHFQHVGLELTAVKPEVINNS